MSRRIRIHWSKIGKSGCSVETDPQVDGYQLFLLCYVLTVILAYQRRWRGEPIKETESFEPLYIVYWARGEKAWRHKTPSRWKYLLLRRYWCTIQNYASRCKKFGAPHDSTLASGTWPMFARATKTLNMRRLSNCWPRVTFHVPHETVLSSSTKHTFPHDPPPLYM